MNNIAALRDLLFKELNALSDPHQKVDLERVRAICGVADRVIDTARLEVQLAAVLKGGTDIPFIESQDPEHPANQPSRTALTPTDPMTRTAQLLAAGPTPEHPWRQRDQRRA